MSNWLHRNWYVAAFALTAGFAVWAGYLTEYLWGPSWGVVGSSLGLLMGFSYFLYGVYLDPRAAARPRWLRVLGARWRRYWHTLFRFHRAVTAWLDGTTVYVGCECGRVFFEEPPTCPTGTGGSVTTPTS